MSRFEKIVKYYEDIKVFDADIEGNKFEYVSKSSLHSGVTSFAYGKALKRECVDVVKTGVVKSKLFFSKKDLQKRRFYIKLIACIKDWQKHENDIIIFVNGQKVVCERYFFENINLGWPGLYFSIPKTILKIGVNTIEIATKNETGAGLLLSAVKILSLPEFRKYSQISALKSVRKGSFYGVALYGVKNIKIISLKNCKYIDYSLSYESNEILILKFTATNVGKAKCVCLADGKKIKIFLPECIEGKDNCLVGSDSDDHRVDDSLESNEILKVFAYSGMGNFYQFRPMYGRNYINLSSKKIWKQRIEFLKDFGTTIGLCDGENVMPYIGEYAGKSFLGEHIHEPYMFFYRELTIAWPEQAEQYFVDCDTLDRSQSFTESKKEYLISLDKTYDKYAKNARGLSSVGSPSLLCVYEADKFDRVTIEPVSGMPMLVGAVRGTIGEKGFWGAHVPLDWYFGAPNDQVKSKKFMTAMLYLYMNGAKYVYSENALFKTNAFSREDAESEFCVNNRKYLREFYDYTVRNPRLGKIKRDLALIYGNNEFFLWQTDERMPELGENDDWDEYMWGKWKDNRSQYYWRAAEEWFPYAENQNSVTDILNLRLFAGNPYGAVDIIPYEKDYSKYKAIALLGWNTYEVGFIDKLNDYVKKGGTVFVSYTHFNYTDRPDKDFEYEKGKKLENLLGIKIGDIKRLIGETTFNSGEKMIPNMPIKIVESKPSTAKVLAYDSANNPVVMENKIGKGKIYFCSVADYYKSNAVVKIFKKVLKIIAEETSDIVLDNKNFAVTEYCIGKEKELSFLNLSCADERKQKCNVKVKVGNKIKKIKLNLSPLKVKTIKIHN